MLSSVSANESPEELQAQLAAARAEAAEAKAEAARLKAEAAEARAAAAQADPSQTAGEDSDQPQTPPPAQPDSNTAEAPAEGSHEPSELAQHIKAGYSFTDDLQTITLGTLLEGGAHTPGVTA